MIMSKSWALGNVSLFINGNKMSTEVKNATLVCKIYIMAEKSDFNKILCQKKYLLYISIAFKKKRKENISAN